MDRDRERFGLRSAAATAIVIAYTAPVVVVVLAALRPTGTSVLRGWGWLDDPATLDSFRLAARTVDFPTLLRNSLAVTVVAVPVTVLLASWTGTAIVLAQGRLRRTLVAVVSLSLLIPTSALWVPRVVLLRLAGLVDTLAAVASPALMATSAFYVVVAAIAAVRLPRSLFDAAAVEGAGPLALWWRVVVPLTRGPLLAIAVLAFAAHWSNLVEPQFLLQSPDRQTVATGLARLRTEESIQLPMVAAGAVLAALPPVVVFLACGRALLGRPRLGTGT